MDVFIEIIKWMFYNDYDFDFSSDEATYVPFSFSFSLVSALLMFFQAIYGIFLDQSYN